VEDPREGRIRPTTGVTVVPSLRRAIDVRSDVRAGRALGRLVRARHPDVVHTHLAKAGALGRVAARRARVPVIVHTFHGHVLDGYFSSKKERVFVQAERELARLSTALVAVSSAVRDDLMRKGIGRHDQWRVIPVGLDLETLLGDGAASGSARRKLGLPAEGHVVGIVGRLVPVKDHVTFLRAAAHLASRGDVTFVVAGDGELRGALEERARGLLGDRVVFTGWIQDLPTLYAAMDVVVSTSRNEGTPVALIEAGAAGKPVVATRVGGVPDVVRDGHTGDLVDAGDAEGVAVRVGRLLDDPALADAGGGGPPAPLTVAALEQAWISMFAGSERLA
jgi:glycosyltransferase involved in cell wall biosynthesis